MSSRLLSQTVSSARLGVVLASACVALGMGCSGYLTPDEVRANLTAPKGQITAATVPLTTKDFFQAKHASSAEDTANFFKTSQSQPGSQAALADGLVAQGSLEKSASFVGDVNIGDIFCAAGLVTSISNFDNCSAGQNCDAHFTLDSCVLRIGSSGDAHASGKIDFDLKNTTQTDLDRTEFRLTFSGFAHSQDATTTANFDGVLSLETTQFKTKDRNEVILSADFSQAVKKINHGVFESDVVQQSRFTAALRFSTETTTENGAHQDSVVLTIEGQSRDLGDKELAQLTLDLKGANGEFTCSWKGAEEQVGTNGAHYTSNGNCVDKATGKTFDFSGTADIKS